MAGNTTSKLLNAYKAAFRSHKYRLARNAPPEKIREILLLMRPVHTGYDLIRIGGEGDGGYLVPDDFEGITTCFSPGVSSVSDFEDHVARAYGIQSYMADYSVDGPAIASDFFHFTKKFIGSYTNDQFIAFDQWVDASADPHDNDLLLQMDIEGHEYDVLIGTNSELLNRFRIVIIEMHGIAAMLNQNAAPLVDAVFRKITRFHDVVHLHPNNCCGSESVHGIEVPRVLEVTLHRKDRRKTVEPRSDFPHRLDRDCVRGRPGLRLSADFYR